MPLSNDEREEDELRRMAESNFDWFPKVYQGALSPLPQVIVNPNLEALRRELNREASKAIAPLVVLKSQGKITQKSRHKSSIPFIHKVAAAVVLIMGSGIPFLPFVRSWGWLQKHPNKLGLYVLELSITVGICWMLVDTKRRFAVFLSVIVVAVFTIAQIIGR